MIQADRAYQCRFQKLLPVQQVQCTHSSEIDVPIPPRVPSNMWQKQSNNSHISSVASQNISPYWILLDWYCTGCVAGYGHVMSRWWYSPTITDCQWENQAALGVIYGDSPVVYGIFACEPHIKAPPGQGKATPDRSVTLNDQA